MVGSSCDDQDLPDLTERYEKTSAKQLESFERINRETRQEYREVLESDREMAYKARAKHASRVPSCDQ